MADIRGTERRAAAADLIQDTEQRTGVAEPQSWRVDQEALRALHRPCDRASRGQTEFKTVSLPPWGGLVIGSAHGFRRRTHRLGR